GPGAGRGGRLQLHRQAPAQGTARGRRGAGPHPLEGGTDQAPARRPPRAAQEGGGADHPETSPGGRPLLLGGVAAAPPQRGEAVAGQGGGAVLLVRLGGAAAAAGGAGPRPRGAVARRGALVRRVGALSGGSDPRLPAPLERGGGLRRRQTDAWLSRPDGLGGPVRGSGARDGVARR